MTKTQHPIDAKCKALGISRRELCRQTGISYRTVESWCSGKRKSPDVYQLWKVARFLGVHIEDLLDPTAIDDDSSETE